MSKAVFHLIDLCNDLAMLKNRQADLVRSVDNLLGDFKMEGIMQKKTSEDNKENEAAATATKQITSVIMDFIYKKSTL